MRHRHGIHCSTGSCYDRRCRQATSVRVPLIAIGQSANIAPLQLNNEIAHCGVATTVDVGHAGWQLAVLKQHVSVWLTGPTGPTNKIDSAGHIGSKVTSLGNEIEVVVKACKNLVCRSTER